MNRETIALRKASLAMRLLSLVGGSFQRARTGGTVQKAEEFFDRFIHNIQPAAQGQIDLVIHRVGSPPGRIMRRTSEHSSTK